MFKTGDKVVVKSINKDEIYGEANDSHYIGMIGTVLHGGDDSCVGEMTTVRFDNNELDAFWINELEIISCDISMEL